MLQPDKHLEINLGPICFLRFIMFGEHNPALKVGIDIDQEVQIFSFAVVCFFLRSRGNNPVESSRIFTRGFPKNFDFHDSAKF